MRKDRRNLLLAALLAAVALLTALAWLILRNHEPPEPVYEGKRLSEWLSLSTNHLSLAGPPRAIRQIGTNAIPTLLRMLRTRDSNIKLKLVALARKQHFININSVSAEDLNNQAAMGFSLLGREAAYALPALMQIYEESISAPSQIATTYVIVGLGPSGKPAVPMLLRTAGDTNANSLVRGTSEWALGTLHDKPELAVPVLINCLKDPEPMVRVGASAGLMNFGPDARPAEPALLDAIKDPDSRVQFSARQALRAIHPAAAAAAGIQ